MAFIDCQGCGCAVDARSVSPCKDCGALLCPDCAQTDEGYCAECAGAALSNDEIGC